MDSREFLQNNPIGTNIYTCPDTEGRYRSILKTCILSAGQYMYKDEFVAAQFQQNDVTFSTDGQIKSYRMLVKNPYKKHEIRRNFGETNGIFLIAEYDMIAVANLDYKSKIWTARRFLTDQSLKTIFTV